MHKQSGKIAIVTPVYVRLKNGEFDSYSFFEVGYMFENENAVQFVLPHIVKRQFVDLGDF
jgi:hypothetical protein